MHEQITNDLKNAMREKDMRKKEVLRGVLTAFTNEAISDGKKPDEKLDDEKAQAVITRLAKQRRDAIAQFTEGGREELARDEQAELEILEEYLPQQMSEDEIREFVKTKKDEMNITDPSDKGKLMGAVMSELKGKADGQLVKNAVDQSF